MKDWEDDDAGENRGILIEAALLSGSILTALMSALHNWIG
jgi:hypothetical protein